MTRRSLMCITALLLATLQTIGAQQTTAHGEKLLARAHHKATVDGDMQGAIVEYKTIVAGAGSDRALAAQALVRMAECYQKLGDAEASRIYERIVRDYSDQSEPARVARVRLDSAASWRNRDVVARRVVSGIEIVNYVGNVSRDGRYVTYQNADAGLGIRDIQTGRSRLVGGLDSNGRGTAGSSAISRDSTRVAFVWFDRSSLSYDLRVVGIASGDAVWPRIVRSSTPDVRYVTPHDWSPDGKHLLVTVSHTDNTHQIGLVAVQDGSLKVIKSLDWRHPGKMSLSSDGRFIAYNFQPDRASSKRDLYVLAIDGSGETAVINHAADDQLLGWTPDGGAIVFASDRSGTSDMWLVSVVDGKPAGPAELVKRNVGQLNTLGITDAGALFYLADNAIQDQYVVRIDASTLNPLGKPTPLTARFAGTNQTPSWSPDGHHIAYVSQRGARGRVASIITIRSTMDGTEREVVPELEYVDGYSGLQWLRDGQSLLAYGRDNAGHLGLFGVDLQTGKATLFAGENPGTGGLQHAVLSADKTTLFYRRVSLEIRQPSIVARNVASGAEQVLYALPALSQPHIALSPDGNQLAFGITDSNTRATHVMTLSLSGGAPREIVRFAYPPAALLWTPDGQRLIFGRGPTFSSPDVDTELWSIETQGARAAEYLGIRHSHLLGARMHPNGREISFVARKGSVEIWALENFLPFRGPTHR